jgi:preprotein translocase subunit YajC
MIAHHEISITMLLYMLTLVSVGYFSNLIYRLFRKKKKKSIKMSFKIKQYGLGDGKNES